MTRLEKDSPCKVNLLLNILGKRSDGFHELETLMHPVNLSDRISFERVGGGIALTCNEPSLPVDATNLVYRAAAAFFNATKIQAGLRVHLEKKIPMAAGLGGGSGNAATTLLGLNELFGQPLATEKLGELAASLGSDVNFFLQKKPALATGRGEKVKSVGSFPALRGTAFLLIHPGFGISTAWAYQNLGRFPSALNGRPGRAEELVSLLTAGQLSNAAKEFYNSLEAPALDKFPILAVIQGFLRENGAAVSLMSGSGSTTFAIASSVNTAECLGEKFKSKFGPNYWTSVVPI
jgi:4-diphosphocytidyl-2-C-methyl-D-erythritol kinase